MTPPDAIGAAGLVALILAYSGWWAWYADAKAAPLLQGWAARSGFTIVRRRHQLFRSGPFNRSNLQAVHRLTLEDEMGRRWQAWSCCGTWFTGMFGRPSKIEVVFDDQADPPG